MSTNVAEAAARVLSGPVHRQGHRQFVLFTLIAAVVAALASWLAELCGLEVWVMFAGFIAWFTRPTSLGQGLSSMLCLWLGIGLAALSYAATGVLAGSLGSLALPVVVFGVAILVVGLRTTSVVSNMLGWFLGLVTFFAAEQPAVFATFADLGAASAIGGFAGWACQALNRRWVER